ncbi:MAG: SDR family oxidoreductase [Alphaproteobacteria bacterium]|nr:SDR family oxidoreductase [Alphaproteobacteria bacterium]
MIDNPFSLSGRTIAITGGNGLIGRTVADAILRSGATTLVLDIAAGKASGDNFRYEAFDITDLDKRGERLSALEAAHGEISGWVNCAYPRTSDWGTALEQISNESWQANIDRHLNAYCLWSSTVAERMAGRNTGSIVNLASIYGMVGPDFTIYEQTTMTMPAAYAAIKGGVIAYSRYLASYFGHKGVRVNCVSPGGVFDSQPEQFVERYNKRLPLGRMARVDEVCWPVVFLLSQASSYITGENIAVDGGWTAI